MGLHRQHWQIPGSADRQPCTFWEVSRDDPEARQSDADLTQQLTASGVAVDRNLDHTVASLGDAFGDPNEMIEQVLDELPEGYRERIKADPDALDAILDEVSASGSSSIPR